MQTARYFKPFSLLMTLALLAPLGASVRASAGTNTTSAAPQQEQQQMGALQRGYRTGYSDGYQAGWRDAAARAARDYRNKDDYQRADRAHATAHGSLEDYRDGYQQGFEVGYDGGYNKRVFDSTVPAGLSRRGVAVGGAGSIADDSGSAARTSGSGGGVSAGESASGNKSSGGVPVRAGAGRSASGIPADTVLLVELVNRLSSDVSQRGDRFEARVIEPAEYEGAQVGGQVARVTRPGKVRGTAELQLTFDQIRFDGGDWQDFSAQVTEVVRRGGDEGIGEVDAEGGVRGRSSTKEDVTRVGAGAGIGAVIGGIAGGGKGAAIGAILGGGAGAGSVMTQRGKEIRLERGQQLMIRASRSARSN
ncbi:MAG TPA: hypothetical protein VM866_10765 [Pyrinomonadaceae bacterium]|nr:hypothetical protein [Pyrinomonadaceae bacterium]